MKTETKDKIKAAFIRAGRTFAQAAVAAIGTTAMIHEVNWAIVLSTSTLAGVLSLLTSWAFGLPEAASDDSSKNGKHFGEE